MVSNGKAFYNGTEGLESGTYTQPKLHSLHVDPQQQLVITGIYILKLLTEMFLQHVPFNL